MEFAVEAVDASGVCLEGSVGYFDRDIGRRRE